MVDEKTAKAIVKELKGSPGYPDTPFMLRQLGDAIMTHAVSKEHAQRAVSRHFQTSRFCPSVQEMTEAMEQTPGTSMSVNCDICLGSGWYHVDSTQNIHGTMVCCRCSAGDLKRAALRGEK